MICCSGADHRPAGLEHIVVGGHPHGRNPGLSRAGRETAQRTPGATKRLYRLLGIQNFASNIVGIISPFVIGLLLDLYDACRRSRSPPGWRSPEPRPTPSLSAAPNHSPRSLPGEDRRMPTSPDLALAHSAALAAASVSLPFWRKIGELPHELKADGSVVTEADRAVEVEIRRLLAEVRPGDAVLGEETGSTGHGPRRWILDGIDGTAVFIAGDDRWQTLIALEVEGVVTVGVAVLPAQAGIWWAELGGGAYRGRLEGESIVDVQRLEVASPTSLEKSTLGVVPPYDVLPSPYRELADSLVHGARLAPWHAHAALLVASGELDLAIQVSGQVWDHAALGLIVTEAGGAFSGLHGQQHPVTGGSVYSSGEPTHSAALARIHPGANGHEG